MYFSFFPPLFLGRTFFVPAKAGLTYELLQTIYHRPFKTQKTGDSAKIACLRHSSVYFVMQKDLLLQQKGRTIHSALAEENIRPAVVCHCKVLRPFFGGTATRGVGGYRMKQIILWVLSKIYYTICNRKAQVFLRIMYIIPYNIRTQKKSGRRKNAGRNSCHGFTLLTFNSALCIIRCFLLKVNEIKRTVTKINFFRIVDLLKFYAQHLLKLLTLY